MGTFQFDPSKTQNANKEAYDAIQSIDSLLNQISGLTKDFSGNRKGFYEGMITNALEGLNLVVSKTKDYATMDDPYRNFRMSENVGVSVEKGILVRMCDKMSRIGNLIEKDSSSVTNESVEDTLIDLMNYANILLCYRKGSGTSENLW